MTFPVFALFFEKWNISLGRDLYMSFERTQDNTILPIDCSAISRKDSSSSPTGEGSSTESEE